jgi:hypothetical protein
MTASGLTGGQARPDIFSVRGANVVLDEDVARLFGVSTKQLNQQVKRNAEKFGDDFSFIATQKEFDILRSQNVTSTQKWGGRRHPPRLFTEHGVVMAATVLRSEQAVAASRMIVKAFVEARKASPPRDLRRNAPASIDFQKSLPAPADVRHGLIAKLDNALSAVLDAIADPKKGTSVGEEARAVALEGLNHIKERLKKPGVENEKTLAEVRKLLAEADDIEAGAASKRADNEHKQFALLAKKLRLIIVAQRAMENGDDNALLNVLKELGDA